MPRNKGRRITYQEVEVRALLALLSLRLQQRPKVKR